MGYCGSLKLIRINFFGSRKPDNLVFSQGFVMKTLVMAALVSLVAVGCGKNGGEGENKAAAPAPAASAPAPAAPVADNAAGEGVFKKVCSMCHQTGAAGAPVVGNKSDWGPRIAKGKDTLYKHAMEGFNGEKGSMPARGGNPSLTDEEVKSAVDYMVGRAS